MSEFIGKKQTNNTISMAEASRTERNKDKIQFVVASCKKRNGWGDENQKQFQLYGREGIVNIFFIIHILRGK